MSLIINLAGVACRTGVADVTLALVGHLHKADRQAVRIEEGVPLRRVAKVGEVSARSKQLFRVQIAHLQDLEQVIRQQSRTLRRVVEPKAIARPPSLRQIARRRIGFAEGSILRAYDAILVFDAFAKADGAAVG